MLMISSQELRYQFKKSDCRPQKVSYNRRNIFNKIVNSLKNIRLSIEEKYRNGHLIKIMGNSKFDSN